jgi:nucleoside-diphosphate-sugar epimerase
MNILLCGASGFIGRHIALALRAQGHHLIAGQSTLPMSEQHGEACCAMDFSTDHTTAHWLPRLAGVDAVVNAVGLLRPTRHRSL